MSYVHFFIGGEYHMSLVIQYSFSISKSTSDYQNQKYWKSDWNVSIAIITSEVSIAFVLSILQSKRFVEFQVNHVRIVSIKCLWCRRKPSNQNQRWLVHWIKAVSMVTMNNSRQDRHSLQVSNLMWMVTFLPVHVLRLFTSWNGNWHHEGRYFHGSLSCRVARKNNMHESNQSIHNQTGVRIFTRFHIWTHKPLSEIILLECLFPIAQ